MARSLTLREKLTCPRCGTLADRVHADGVVFIMGLVPGKHRTVELSEDGDIIDITAECVCGTSARIVLDSDRRVDHVRWEYPQGDHDHCPLSRRVDKPTAHTWRFDGDDPYTVCVFCDQTRDAITGKVIKEGKRA